FPAIASLEAHAAHGEVVASCCHVSRFIQVFYPRRVHLVEAVFEGLDARPLQAEAQLLLGSDEVIHLQLWRPLVGLEGGHTSTPLMDEPRLAVNILGAEVHRETGRRIPGHTCRVAEVLLAEILFCAVERGEDRHRTGPVAAPS